MRGMRISAALCSAALAVGLMAGCGGADGSNDRGERTVTVVPSPSASKPTDAGWHAVNSKQLPPASAALEMAEDEQGREFEQRAIDARTPDPCALISMFRYGKIMQQDAYILGNGSPYDPDSRRNCYITRGPQKNSGGKIENSAFTADRIGIYRESGDTYETLYRTFADGSDCAIYPENEPLQPGDKCAVANLDPYGYGLDSSPSSANVPEAWYYLRIDADGNRNTTLVVKFSNGYMLTWEFNGDDQGKAKNAAMIMANDLREKFGLNAG